MGGIQSELIQLAPPLNPCCTTTSAPNAPADTAAAATAVVRPTVQQRLREKDARQR